MQQRLGTITLTHDGGEAIELFEWCATSVDAVTQTNAAASASDARVRDLQTAVGELKSQLDELVAAKQEDEVVLLQKFRDLLNEKKVKIREQQKIITDLSANDAPREEVDEVDEVDEVQTAKGGRKAPKRKAQAVENESPEEDVDMTAEKGESEDEDAESTTEATASVANDEDEDEDADMDMDRTADEAAREPLPPQKTQGAPPPPRALPFQKKRQAVAADDSDDDEL